MNPTNEPSTLASQNIAPEAPKIYDPTGLQSGKERIPLRFRILGYVPAADKEESDQYNRFHPNDLVKVRSILDKTFYWQVMDGFNEETKLIPFRGVIQKRVIRKAPDIWSIAPGEVKVIPGWSAAVMIENMYKKYIINETDNKPRPAETKNRPITYNFSNPAKQEELISKMFLGVETLARGNYNYMSSSPSTQLPSTAPINQPESDGNISVEDLAKELGISVEPN